MMGSLLVQNEREIQSPSRLPQTSIIFNSGASYLLTYNSMAGIEQRLLVAQSLQEFGGS